MSIATFNSSCVDMTDYYTVPMEMLRVYNEETGLYRIKGAEEIESMRGMTFKTAINIAEIQAEAEKNANYIDIPDEQIAKFDNISRYHPTGDEKYDRKVNEALDYYESCFDCRNSHDYDELTAKEDFTGMTTAEKYLAVYKKYQHCYGENFLDGSAASLWAVPYDYDYYGHVLTKFYRETEDICGDNKAAMAARREALYGDCENDSEVRDAIIKKYMDGKPSNGITRRDYNKIVREMDMCGVGGGISNNLQEWAYIPKNIHNLSHESFSSAKYLDSYLTSTDIEDITRSYDYLRRCGSANDTYFTALSQITSKFGVAKNSSLMEQFNNIKGIKL